jgi:hypothetical protein
MDRRDRAHSAPEQAAWWAEANEWLGRYFDAVDQQLECDLGQSTEGQPPALKPAKPRVLFLHGQRRSRPA